MNRRVCYLVLSVAAWGCDFGLAEERTVSPDAPQGTIETQQSGPQGWGRRFRDLWRRDSPYLKNDASVKAAYRVATQEAAKATAQVLADDKVVALGAVVDPQGYIVTKASLLAGKITCQVAGREALEATLVGANLEHDLALLKVDASDLTPVVWRTEPAPPGTLVAAVAPDGDAIGIGVVSAEPRRVPGPRRQSRRPGWLGVSLGGGDTEAGITEVMEGTPAADAGLQAGDEIQSIDGEAMRSMDQVIETVGSHAPGDKLVIVVRREEEQLTREVVLGRRPQNTMPEDEWGGGPFSVRREGFPSVLPHDVAVLPSQCGGPLIDMDGEVVGINIARALRVTTYAIPADIVQQFVAPLKK